MEKKERPIINFNAPIYNNGGTINGDIMNPIYHMGGSDSFAHVDLEKIRKCLVQLNDSGIIIDDKQWYAIFAVLSQDCGFPKKISSFCAYVEKLDLDNGFEHKCTYDNFRKVSTEIPHLPQNVDLWNPEMENLNEKEKNLAITAQSLRNMLGFS